jgi:hypothetical protein
LGSILKIIPLALALLLAACGTGATSGGAPTTSAVAQPTRPAPTAGATSQPTAAPEATAAPAPPTATSQPTAAAEPSPPARPTSERPGTDNGTTGATPQAGVLVVYRKTGGIAGIDRTLTVYDDGRVELSGTGDTGQAIQAPPDSLSALRGLLASPEFAALNARYRASGADLFTYEISVPATGQTVVTMDGAPSPPALTQAIAQLEALARTTATQ